MKLVTLVNRSSKTLEGLWDGHRFELTPGAHQFGELQAMKFKEQHPVMGTEDPYSLNKLYLLGIKEHGDDLTPIEQTEAISLMDLSEKIRSGELKIVKGNGLYRQTDRTAPLVTSGPVDSTFVKP
jgi:hypothetical protein